MEAESGRPTLLEKLAERRSAEELPREIEGTLREESTESLPLGFR
jgi:hypothetical protein